jgi:hypothetical protein
MEEDLLSAEQAVGEPREPAPPDPEIENARIKEAFQASLSKETRSTGIWMLVWGGISLIASGFFNASWGLLLVAVGVASFFIKDVAMLVVYAITMAWAGIWNIFSSYLNGSWGWAIFSLIQFYWALRIFQNFYRFRRMQTELPISSTRPKPITRILPATGCLLSVVAFFGFMAWLVVIMLIYGAGVISISDRVLNLTMNLVLNTAILGFAVCLGALLSGYRYKAISIIGMVVCLLLIIGWFVLMLLPSEPEGLITILS